MSDTPKIGRTYDGLPCGQGLGTVLRVELDDDGRWTGVLVRYAAGCMPMPPDGRPDAPMNEWLLPEGETWIDAATWRELAPQRRR